jgi:hypothetical protein
MHLSNQQQLLNPIYGPQLIHCHVFPMRVQLTFDTTTGLVTHFRVAISSCLCTVYDDIVGAWS